MDTAILCDKKKAVQARGRRLKSLRMMADLSRKDLQDKYLIPTSTIQAWEEGKLGGLTEKGAKKMVKALRQEGIFCTIEWLLYGAGDVPYLGEITHALPETLENEHLVVSSLCSQNAIGKELAFFRYLFPNAISYVIKDDGMMPFYQIGDVIAGIRYTDQEIIKGVDRDCIVELATGEMLLRRVRLGSHSTYYHLQCTYLDTQVPQPFLYNQELLAVAPVVWHRRNEC